MGIILHLISHAVFFYAVYTFISTYAGKSRLPVIATILSYCFCSALMCAFPAAIQSNAGMSVMFGLLTFLLTLPHSCTLKQRLCCTGTICTAGILLNLAAAALFRCEAGTASGLIQDVAALTAAFLCKLKSRRGKAPAELAHIYCLMITSAGTAVVGLLTVREETAHDLLIAVILLLVNQLNYCCVNRLEQKNLESEQILRVAETSCDAYRNQLRIMNESQQQLRYVRHDLKRHLFCIRDMVSSGNSAEVTAYLNDLEDAVCAPHIYARSGHREIDSLINYKLGLAAQLGTEIVCKIELPAELHVSAFDMTVILGNLLDNALEALQGAEQRILNLSLTYNKGIICIDIQNSCSAHVQKPQDGCEHGLGLMSVRSVLKKYHGCLQAVPDEHTYQATVSFFNFAEPVHHQS